jgi:hypothetical protein
MAINQTFRTGYTATLGMRGLQTWSASENPETWREAILYLYPNGNTPLTAIMSKLKNTKETNPHFHWFTKKTAARSMSIKGVYTDNSLSSVYTGGATDGTVLFVNLTNANDANLVRIGQTFMLRVDGNTGKDTVGKIVSVQRTGTVSSTYIGLQLMENDKGACVSAAVTTGMVTGNINPEGSGHPEAISTHPIECENMLQITRNSLSMTRTAQQSLVSLRTKEGYAEAKKECLENHAMDMEMTAMYGVPGWTMGLNGQPERATGGLRWFIREYAPDNEIDMARISEYHGAPWSEYGKDAINNVIRKSFKWGPSNEKVVLCGDGALQGIQDLVNANSQYIINEGEAAYGINVTKLKTVFGIWNLVRAPLLTLEESDTNTMIVLEPKNLEYRYLQDTTFLEDVTQGKGGITAIDGKVEGYLAEWGLACYFPETFMWLTNVGVNNVLP